MYESAVELEDDQAMKRLCAVPTCGQPAAGYSTLCEGHKRSLRRHGDAEQTGVTVHELKPFRDRVTQRRQRNPGNAAWGLLRARWDALADHARVVVAIEAKGTPGVSHERQAARQVLTLHGSVAADDVVDVALAMVVYQELRPARFKSDEAFDVQLARRVRGLSPANAEQYLETSTGRTRRTYRETPPRVLLTLASWLKSAFGVAGISLAKLEAREADGSREERQRMADALGAMQ